MIAAVVSTVIHMITEEEYRNIGKNSFFSVEWWFFSGLVSEISKNYSILASVYPPCLSDYIFED
jgi:hypothetical protein